MSTPILFKEDLGQRRYDLGAFLVAYFGAYSDDAARRYLTSAIFPVYILHQTVIVVVAHALKPSLLYPPVEGVLLVLVAAATCFLSYEAIRRVRLLRPLFGLEQGAAGPQKQKSSRDAVAAQRLAPQLAVPQDIKWRPL